jgi:monovalent cation:H+ antiporter, CPA1 family
MDVLDIITLLIFLAALFTFINIRFLKMPSTIGLMVLALVMSITLVISGYFVPSIYNGAQSIMLKFDFSEVLLNVMLSFLLFAGAISIDLRKLAEEKWSILILATFGVLISTLVVGVLMYLFLPYLGIYLELIYCLLFGALISPTDPIAVLAIIKKLKISKNLEIKIAGESLFNDGIAVVVFLTMLTIANLGLENFEIGNVALLFGQEVLGGIMLGLGFGFIGFHFLKYVDNKHTELEVLITLSMVMAGNRIAEELSVSSPLAIVVMGLFIGNEGRSEQLSDVAGEYVFKFWHLLDEALNAILFILIGLEMLIIPFKLDYFLAGGAAIVIVLIGRYVGVSIPILAMQTKRQFQKGTIKILTWGGLRGGVSVALALYLPDAMPAKEIIVAITYSVVVFSIIIQGLTIGKLIKNQVGIIAEDDQTLVQESH